MAEEFVPKFDMGAVPPNLPTRSPQDDRERLKIMLYGSTEGIREMIFRLSQSGIAEVGAWSRFMPAPNSSEMMSILILYRRRGS